MPFSDSLVDETRHYLVRYRIEADNPKQAVLMAEEGNTHGETDVSFEGVINRGGPSASPPPIPIFIRVEYDLAYSGGDYSGSGQTVKLLLDGLTDENLPERFQQVTGHNPVHIIHYTFDEPVDADGEYLD